MINTFPLNKNYIVSTQCTIVDTGLKMQSY